MQKRYKEAAEQIHFLYEQSLEAVLDDEDDEMNEILHDEIDAEYAQSLKLIEYANKEDDVLIESVLEKNIENTLRCLDMIGIGR